MESPESSKPVATETALAQESPIFSYISSLSPIQPVKDPAVTQGFPGLNSPPLVFTSPRLNLRSQPTYLKSRAKFHGLSAAPLSRQDEGCKESVTAHMGSENLDSQLIAKQLTCTFNVSDVNRPGNDQIESPTECPDMFLTDVMTTDTVDSNGSSDSTSKTSDYVDQQPDATSVDEPAEKVDEHNIRINEEIDNVSPTLTRQTEDAQKEDTRLDATVIETNIKNRDRISDQCIKIKSELSVGHALINREQENPTTEEEKSGQSAPLDLCSHMLSGSMQNGEENENSVEATGAALTEPSLEEAFQRRGVRRRCLQFEDAQHQVISNHPAQNLEDSGGVQNLERPLTVVNENQTVTQPASHPRNNLGSSVMVHKPIGLHLNKIVYSGPQAGSGSSANMNIVRSGKFSIRAKKLIPMMNTPSDNSTSSSILSHAESGLSRTDDNRHEVYTSETAMSASSLSTCTIKTLNYSVALNLVDEGSTPGNKRTCDIITDGVSDDLTKSSVKKKRKKSLDLADGNGCKRCNCKKSNCLKLYCDCFAAGIYCVESCACQACLNRPQYEETVLDKRQQIESRNPLAFAPKVVKHLIAPPARSCEDDQTHFTPSSARHKSGCNCKKSMCVKKYCECYQANVGCSDGCRCEGCQNVFGRKGDYRMIKDVPDDENTTEKTDGLSVEKIELLASGNGLYHSELLNPHILTPLTPAFQFSNHRKDASKAWSRPGKHLQSTESGLTFGPQYVMSPYSPTNIDSNAKVSDTANKILDLVSFDPELDYRGNAETVNDVSAGKMEPLFGISNHQDSPVTPMAVHSGIKNLQVFMQYDTPDVLNDAPMPLNTVKVISPDKKRVSPLHGQEHEFGCSSSAGVRTGRKFILKAVPSFPPLTPCIDSKISAVEPTNDPQNCSNDN